MYQPVNRVVLVIPEKAPEQTESGLYLPTHDITKIQTRGVVHSSNSPLARKGDKLVFYRSGTVSVPASPIVGADQLMVVWERDIVAIDNGTDAPFPIPADDK